MAERDLPPLALEAPETIGIGARLREAKVRARLLGEPLAPVKIGRFTVLEHVGTGGMGEVYAAYDDKLERKVAIKLVRGGAGKDARANARLLEEAKLLAQLSHPNVVHLYDAGELDGRVFLAMELVRGQTLAAYLARAQDLPEHKRRAEVLHHFIAAGRGLEAAHQAKLAHRDFKPGNVLVGDDGRVRVVDFGLAGVLGPTHAATEAQPHAARSPAVASPSALAAANAAGAERRDLERHRSAARGDGRAGAPPHDDAAPADDIDDREPHDRLAAPAALASTEPAPAPRGDHAPAPLPGGWIAGTPRYMAPEQLRGQVGDAKSDQYSFCVALYEALCGRLPAESRGSGEPPPLPTSAAPAAVRRALARGLAEEPTRRFPDMTALLRELERGPRRRAQLLAGGALVTAAVGVAAALWPSTADQPACNAGAAELGDAWSPARRAAAARALDDTAARLGQRTPAAPPPAGDSAKATALEPARAYARDAARRTLTALDHYAAEWIARRDGACLAYRRGGESANLYDRRLACLARRRAALDSAAAVLAEGAAGSLDQAVEVGATLPSLADCADVDSLLTAAPLPPGDAERRRVRELEQQLDRARALEVAGQGEAALALLDQVGQAAEQVRYPPLSARALLARARAEIATSYEGCSACRPALERALALGLEHGLDELVVEAFARLVFVVSAEPDHAEQALAYVPLAEAVARRVPDRRFVSALLANNIGVVHMGRGEPARALEQFERSVAVAGPRAQELELLRARTNVAMVTPEPALRSARLLEAIAASAARLGALHGQTLRQRVIAALYTPSPARARAELASACHDLAAYHPGAPDWPSYCLYHLGLLEAENGHFDASAALLEAFVAAPRPTAGEPPAPSPEVELARAATLLARGEPAAAAQAFRSARARAGEPSERAWWTMAQPALAELGLGESLLAAGQVAAARPALERALPLLDALAARSFAVEYRAQRARAATALARVLRAERSPEAQVRAAELDAQARAYWQQAGDGYAWRLTPASSRLP